MYGYVCNQLIMTNEAAQALKGVQNDLVSQGYSLVVYDSFRPQRTVDFFVDWANNITDLKMKEFYYPYLNGSKLQLFDQGYIASKSGHSRGSTVDLSIIKLGDKVKPVEVSNHTLVNNTLMPFLDDGTVDMGSSFDLMHPASWHDSPFIVN